MSEMPSNPQGRPLYNHQLFEYWYRGYDDGRNGLPALGWMKQSWPEDGYLAYLHGHEAACGVESEELDRNRRVDRKIAEKNRWQGHDIWGNPA